MAKVMEYTTKNGVKVEFYDDAYANASPEEIQRRIKIAQQTAWACARTLERIRREKEQQI